MNTQGCQTSFYIFVPVLFIFGSSVTALSHEGEQCKDGVINLDEEHLEKLPDNTNKMFVWCEQH